MRPLPSLQSQHLGGAAPDIRGDLNGVAIWFGDHRETIFPSLASASEAYRAIRKARCELAAIFAKASAS